MNSCVCITTTSGANSGGVRPRPCNLLLLHFVLLSLLYTSVTEVANAASTFEERCGGSSFHSIADAHSLCLSYSEFLATPRTQDEFDAIHSFSPLGSILGGTTPSGSTWKWAYGPFADTVFYIDDIGDITTEGVPWHSSADLSGSTTLVTYYRGGGGQWSTTTFPTSEKCAVCQSITTCGEVCSTTGTQSYSGAAWSSCTCVCKSGYVGPTCSRQTEYFCDAARLTDVSVARGECTSRGGFLATPTSLGIMNELRSLSSTTTILLGGSDELVEGQWVWSDGPFANQQFYQGVSGSGYAVNGFPTYWQTSEPNNFIHTADTTAIGEDHLTLYPALWNDASMSGTTIYCYACQYTGCSISSPCMSPNTLTATGTKFTDCVCGCKDGFGGPFCQCPLNGCDLRGGVMVQGPTSCSCVCKPNYNGVNCDERTDTPTPSTTLLATDTLLVTTTESVVPTPTTSHQQTRTSTHSLPHTPTLSGSTSPTRASTATASAPQSETHSSSPSATVLFTSTISLPFTHTISDSTSPTIYGTKSLTLAQTTTGSVPHTHSASSTLTVTSANTATTSPSQTHTPSSTESATLLSTDTTSMPMSHTSSTTPSPTAPFTATSSESTSNTPSTSPTAYTPTYTLLATASSSIPVTSTPTHSPHTQTISATVTRAASSWSPTLTPSSVPTLSVSGGTGTTTMSDSRPPTSTMSAASTPSQEETETHYVHITKSQSPTVSYPGTVSHSMPPTNTPQPTSTHTPVAEDELLGAVPRACPAVTMMLSRADSNISVHTPIGSTTIDDTDVREGRLVVNISLVGSEFAFRASMPGSIVFGLESTGIQDPRSFPAVVNTADIVCGFSPPESRRVIECTFPRSPDYTIRVAELLVVRGDGSGVVPACAPSPWTLGTIHVKPSKVDVLTQVFQVAAAVVTGVATAVVMLLADGTPIEIQVMIVLLNSACASSVDRESVLLVRYFLSPAIHLGWWWVVVVNVCTAVGFIGMHTGFVAGVYAYRLRGARKEMPLGKGRKRAPVTTERKYEIWRDVSSTLLYPGLPLAICHVMYIGVACGTFDVLSSTNGADAAVSILGIAFLAAVPIVDAYLLSRVVTVAYVAYDLLGCVPKNRCVAWLYPKGVWGPTADVRRYFGLIGPYRNGYRYGTLLPLGLALLSALTMHGLNGVVACDYLFVAMTVLVVLVGVVFLFLRPTRATAQSLLTSLCLICVGLLAVMQIIAIRANSPGVEAAKSALNYTVVFMVIVRSAHNMFVAYIEWKWAREVDAASEAAAAEGATQHLHTNRQPRGPDELVDVEEDAINMGPKEGPPPVDTLRGNNHNNNNGIHIPSSDVTTNTTTTRSSSEASSRRKSLGFGALLDRHALEEIDHVARLQLPSPNMVVDDEFEVTSASTTTQRPGTTASRRSITSSICTQDRLVRVEKEYTSRQQERRQRLDSIVPISGPRPSPGADNHHDLDDEYSSPDEAESPTPQQHLYDMVVSFSEDGGDHHNDRQQVLLLDQTGDALELIGSRSATSMATSLPSPSCGATVRQQHYFPQHTSFDDEYVPNDEDATRHIVGGDCVSITISPDGADVVGVGGDVRRVRGTFLSPSHRDSPQAHSGGGSKTTSQIRSEVSFVDVCSFSSVGTEGMTGFPTSRPYDQFPVGYNNSNNRRRRSSIMMMSPTDERMQFSGSGVDDGMLDNNNRMLVDSFFTHHSGYNQQQQLNGDGMDMSFDPALLVGGRSGVVACGGSEGEALTPLHRGVGGDVTPVLSALQDPSYHRLATAAHAYHSTASPSHTSSPNAIPTSIMLFPKLQHTSNTDGIHQATTTSMSYTSVPEVHRVTYTQQQPRGSTNDTSTTSTLDLINNSSSSNNGVNIGNGGYDGYSECTIPAAIVHIFPPTSGSNAHHKSNAPSVDYGVVVPRGNNSTNPTRKDPLSDSLFDEGGHQPDPTPLVQLPDAPSSPPSGVVVPVDNIGLFDTRSTFDAVLSLPRLVGGDDKDDTGTPQAVIFNGGGSGSLSAGDDDDDDDGSSWGEGDDPSMDPPFVFKF